MKVKHLIFYDWILIALIFLYVLVGSSFKFKDSGEYVFFVLLLPQAIIIPPCIWYFTFFNILKKAGDGASIVKGYKPVTVLAVLFFLLIIFSYFYFWRLGLSGDDFRVNVLFYLTALSHSLGLSTTILAGVAAYRMFIRMSARGYRKLLK